jgi:GTP-binding protein Era
MENISTRSGFAALIGRPNVGKSTLINHLLGQKIAITSRKPQTTRNKIQCVYTCERGQIVFQDTPGIHAAKNKLGEYMVNTAEHTLRDADVALWLVEPQEHIASGDLHIAKLLSGAKTPVILVINKCDKVKKTEIAGVIEAYKKAGSYDDIIAISAKHGTNLDELITAVFKYLPYGPMYFDEDTVTDQPVRQIASEIIREKALRCLGDEIPHGIAVMIEKMRKRPNGDITDIEADIVCERNSHKGIIIGKNGAVLKKIGSEARTDIERLIEGRVNLKLWVKVRSQWRDIELLLKNYGYDKSEL